MTQNYEQTFVPVNGSLAYDDPSVRAVEFARRIREYHRIYLAPACQVLGIRCPSAPSELEILNL